MEGVNWKVAWMGLCSSSPVVVRQPLSSKVTLSLAAAAASGYFGRPASA